MTKTKIKTKALLLCIALAGCAADDEEDKPACNSPWLSDRAREDLSDESCKIYAQLCMQPGYATNTWCTSPDSAASGGQRPGDAG
jgi:hypothetical protein